MNSKNSKVRGFIKKHSNKIILGSVLIVTYVVSQYSYRKGGIRGFNNGYNRGFGDTIKWCERNIEDVQLTDKVNTWAQENPEKWCGGQIKKEEA